MTDKPVLGFIGLGLMGEPMVSRLLDSGHQVHCWARNEDKLKNSINRGAFGASSIRELINQCDILMLCVSDSRAISDIVLGCHGLLQSISEELPPRLHRIIDFSSIDPKTTIAVADVLKAKGIEWIDCPVSGGVAGATAGTLSIMCGGDEEAIDDSRKILSCLANKVTRMGSIGSGQMTKICNQMIVSCNVMVMAEALAMAESGGVDSSMIAQALGGGFADSSVLQITGPRMANREFEDPKWHVKTLLKDLDMAVAQSQLQASATPMTGLAAQLMRAHALQGNASKDPASLIACYATDSVEPLA